VDPTAVVGGKVNVIGSNARLGKSELMVVEADESDGSFLKLHPSIAVVTNIDPSTWITTGRSMPEGRLRRVLQPRAVLRPQRACLDHPNVQALLPHIEKRVVTYGTVHTADYRVENIELDGFATKFRAFRHEDDLGQFTCRWSAPTTR